MAKKKGKKLRAGKSLEPQKSLDIPEYPIFHPRLNQIRQGGGLR